MTDARNPALTAFLDERKVEELLAGMDDRQRSREVFEFIAERRRGTHAQLIELVAALEAARADADDYRAERDVLQGDVERLQERVLHAEAEAAGLRELLQRDLVARVVRRAAATGRWVRGAAR